MEALLGSGNQFVAFSQCETIGNEACSSKSINFRKRRGLVILKKCGMISTESINGGKSDETGKR
jgi:hypothetical protein